MIMNPFEEYQLLGTVGFNLAGEYNPEIQYSFFDVVYYRGSSYVAKVDNPDTEPQRNDQWQAIALGYADIENLVTGIKGAAEKNYRVGDVSISIQDLGYEDVVTGIEYNDKPVQAGIVKIHSISGISINDEPIEHGVIVTDMVKSLTVNGEYFRGDVELNILNDITINGKPVENGADLSPVESISINKKAAEITEGHIDLNLPEVIRLNGTDYNPDEDGIVTINAIEQVSVNGEEIESEDGAISLNLADKIILNETEYSVDEDGTITLNAIEGVSVNGNLTEDENGYIDLKIPEIVKLNDTEYKADENGIVELSAIESILVNNKEAAIHNGAANLEVPEKIVLNDTEYLPDADGTISLNAIESITLNGKYVADDNGEVNLNVIDTIKVNGQSVTPVNGVVSLTIEPNARTIFGVAEGDGSSARKMMSGLDKDTLVTGTLVAIRFASTNTVADVTVNDIPLTINAQPITESNAATFIAGSLFFFMYDGTALDYLAGSHPVMNILEFTFETDGWQEVDEDYVYDMELPVSEHSFVEIFATGTKENQQILSEAGLFVVSQSDGLVQVGSLIKPENNMSVRIRIT